MTFVLYTPRTVSAVSRGRAAVDGIGTCRFHPGDLDQVGIKGRECVILIDVGTQRVALRSASSAAEFSEPTAKVHRGKSGTKAAISLRGALKELGWNDPTKVNGMYEVVIKDNLAIVMFNKKVGNIGPGPGKRK